MWTAKEFDAHCGLEDTVKIDADGDTASESDLDPLNNTVEKD
jgi:hypothetical protein